MDSPTERVVVNSRPRLRPAFLAPHRRMAHCGHIVLLTVGSFNITRTIIRERIGGLAGLLLQNSDFRNGVLSGVGGSAALGIALTVAAAVYAASRPRGTRNSGNNGDSSSGGGAAPVADEAGEGTGERRQHGGEAEGKPAEEGVVGEYLLWLLRNRELQVGELLRELVQLRGRVGHLSVQSTSWRLRGKAGEERLGRLLADCYVAEKGLQQEKRRVARLEASNGGLCSELRSARCAKGAAEAFAARELALGLAYRNNWRTAETQVWRVPSRCC